jgi:hypothetical protein
VLVVGRPVTRNYLEVRATDGTDRTGLGKLTQGVQVDTGVCLPGVKRQRECLATNTGVPRSIPGVARFF